MATGRLKPVELTPEISAAAAESNAWPFEEARKIVARYAKSGFPAKGVLFETGYGPSGLPHIGTFGEVARTSMVRHAFRVITEDKVPTRLLCFSDDMDGMRKIPDNVPDRAFLEPHLHKPLTVVPNPFGGDYESFGHHNNAMLRRFLDTFGFDYEFASATDYYRSGRFDAVLRKAAADSDLIITSGGVSVGEEDHIKPAVEAEGRLNMWQIAIKPGKPLAFGEIDRAAGTPAFFIGLPGNPVSSFVTFLLFVRPFILRMQGVKDIAPKAFAMRADSAWPKADRRNELLRAKINAEGGLDLFPNQSSGVLTSTVWGDGLIDNPPERTIAVGDIVHFIPFAELLY